MRFWVRVRVRARVVRYFQFRVVVYFQFKSTHQFIDVDAPSSSLRTAESNLKARNNALSIEILRTARDETVPFGFVCNVC